MGYMLEIKDIYKTFNAGTINECTIIMRTLLGELHTIRL